MSVSSRCGLDKLDSKHASLTLAFRHRETSTPCISGGVGMAVNAVAVGGGVEVRGGLPLRESRRAVSACLHILTKHNDGVCAVLRSFSDRWPETLDLAGLPHC